MGRIVKLQRSETEKATTVLFVGTRNAGATLVAEALLREHRAEGICAFSAGVTPADSADPRVIAALARAEVDYDGLWPKHWLGFVSDRRVTIEHMVIIGAPRISSTLFSSAQHPSLHHWPDPFTGQCNVQDEKWFRQWQKRVNDLLHEIRALKRVDALASLEGATVTTGR